MFGCEERGALMNGLPYYKAYPRDFIEGTIGMPFEVKCAYRVVLDLIYMQGGNLPDDARYISGLLGCSLRKWKSVREALVGSGKLVVSGEFLTNYRAVSELETLSKLQDKQRENATKPRKNNGLNKATAEQTRVKPEPDIREEEPNGSLSETSSDARKKRKEYPEEFESAWLSYPRDPNMSKAEAFDAWKKLDAADKDALAASIPAFVAYCRANPDYRPIHMCRYIAKRRFDGHGKPTQAPGTDEATWQKRLRFARARQTWSALEWGPRPNSPGCMVPQHLVQPTDGHGWAEFRQEAA